MVYKKERVSSMDLSGLVNKISGSISSEVNKVVKNIPLQYAYIGYLVSKGTSMENITVNGNILRDIYINTYITIDPVVLILMEDGTYKDLETNNKYSKVDYNMLVSKHIARGNSLNISDFPMYNRNNYIGVFNISKFEDVVNKVIDDEMHSKALILNVETRLKSSYTLMEMNSILKKYLKNDSESVVKTFVVPPVLRDELDDIKTVFGLEKDFLYSYLGMSEEDIIKSLKEKSNEYMSIRNQNF